MTLCVQFEPLKIQCIECIGDEVVVRLSDLSSVQRIDSVAIQPSRSSHTCASVSYSYRESSSWKRRR